jgi:hypothetical protein
MNTIIRPLMMRPTQSMVFEGGTVCVPDGINPFL